MRARLGPGCSASSRWLVVLLAGLLAVGAAGLLAPSLERARRASLAATGEEELTLFPSGRLLGFLSLGHRTLAADLAWLEAIQYYGRHHLEDGRYPLAEHLFRVTTDLDPQFRNAYIFGGLVLGDDVGSLPAARELFARGERENPRDWRIPFHHGFLEYLRGDAEIGAMAMERASRRPGARPYATRMAAHACAKVGRRELAARLWEEIAAEGDESLRDLAERKLRELEEEDGEGNEEGRREGNGRIPQ